MTSSIECQELYISKLAFSSCHVLHACQNVDWETKMAKTFEQLVPAPAGAFRRHQPSYSPAEVGEAARLGADRLHARRRVANRLWESLKKEPYVNSRRRRHRATRRMQAGARRSARDLSVGLAGRRRRQHRGGDVSGPEPYPANADPSFAAASTARFTQPTRSSTPKVAPRSTGSCLVVADAEAGFGGPLNCSRS